MVVVQPDKKSVAVQYLSLADAAGVDWDAACALDERQLTMRLLM